MHATEMERAITAATALVSELGLVVDEARIVGNSNKLGPRLLPCDVFARVAFSGQVASRRGSSGCMQVWRSSTWLRRTSATASAKPSGSLEAMRERHGSKTPTASFCSRRYGAAAAGSPSDPHATSCCMANHTQETS